MSDDTNMDVPDGARQRPASTRREASPNDRPGIAPAPTEREGKEPVATERAGGSYYGEESLPSSLAERFTIVEAFDARGAESDSFLVRDLADAEFFLKVYRRGFAPKEDVLHRLQGADPKEVVRLIDFGRTREGRWFEQLEFAPFGTLGEMMAQWSGPKPTDFVQEVLVELSTALCHIHALDIEHRDLKPENILVRQRNPLDLVLTDFGIASTLDASVRFTSTHRTILYAPPEAILGQVFKSRWDYWSLGMMLVEMLAGEHPLNGSSELSAGRLITTSVDRLADGVTDPTWHNLCRGLLRRDPRHRWGSKEVQQWLKNADDPSLIVAEDVVDDGAGSKRATPIRFSGADFHSPAELSAAMSANWTDAMALWRTRQQVLQDWLRQDLGLGQLAGAIADVDRLQGRGPDAQLFLVIHSLDPSRTPSFKDRILTLDSIAEAGLAAVSGDGELRTWLNELQALDILTLAALLPEFNRDLASIVGEWNSAISDFQALSVKVGHASDGKVTAPELDTSSLPILLGAATPGEAGLRALRERAESSASSSALSLLWFNELGEASAASPAAALLMTLLAPAAEAEVDASRGRRAQRNALLWQYMGGGAMMASIAGCLWWAGARVYCDGPNQICSDVAWHAQVIGVVDLVFSGAALVAAVAVLVTVHTRTSGKD